MHHNTYGNFLKNSCILADVFVCVCVCVISFKSCFLNWIYTILVIPLDSDYI